LTRGRFLTIERTILLFLLVALFFEKMLLDTTAVPVLLFIVPQIVKTKISVLLRESPFTDRLMNTNENASRKDSNALGVSGQLPLSTENSFHFFVFQAHHLWKQERSGFVKGK
jgi:small-conductance mechanosensitive channel